MNNYHLTFIVYQVITWSQFYYIPWSGETAPGFWDGGTASVITTQVRPLHYRNKVGKTHANPKKCDWKRKWQIRNETKTLLQVLEVVATGALWERVPRHVLGTLSTPCTSRPVDTPHPLGEKGAGGEGVTMAQPGRGLRTHGMRTAITGNVVPTINGGILPSICLRCKSSSSSTMLFIL